MVVSIAITAIACTVSDARAVSIVSLGSSGGIHLKPESRLVYAFLYIKVDKMSSNVKYFAQIFAILDMA